MGISSPSEFLFLRLAALEKMVGIDHFDIRQPLSSRVDAVQKAFEVMRNDVGRSNPACQRQGSWYGVY